MTPNDLVPQSIQLLLELDSKFGRQVLDDWISLNEHSETLWNAMVAKYEGADETALAQEFAEQRSKHYAVIVTERDRFAKAASTGREFRDGLGQ